jgi:serine/threonine protein phosphatase PrpC
MSAFSTASTSIQGDQIATSAIGISEDFREFDHSKMIKCFKSAYSHEEMNPRRRFTMEDVHRIVPKLLEIDNTIYSYFGVYDGHGGRQIVDYLEENLENNIATEISHNDDATMQERLTRAFLITDMKSRQSNIKTSGATAVCTLIKTEFKEDGEVSRTLYVANAGDSRAVIAERNDSDINVIGSGEGFDRVVSCNAHRLSFDHRPEDESEFKRVKDAGGFITRGRVLGILAVTRSFGDHGMKDFVVAEPYITETKLDIGVHYPFLILACDGVWDVMSDQEAVDLVLERYKEIGPYPECADLIVKTAIAKGCGDNVTAIVVFL